MASSGPTACNICLRYLKKAKSKELISNKTANNVRPFSGYCTTTWALQHAIILLNLIAILIIPIVYQYANSSHYHRLLSDSEK